jgi:mono/diheme cytochrome c family protein
MWTDQRSIELRPLALVMLGGWLLTGCGGEPPATETARNTPAVAAAPSSAPPAQATTASAAEPRTVADLFPAGQGRDLVMNNCASCHNVACSVIGQRSAERWDALKESHKDKVSGPDLDTIFAYLKTNFDNTKPEPKVPPAFLEGGCTPF